MNIYRKLLIKITSILHPAMKRDEHISAEHAEYLKCYYYRLNNK